MANFIAEILSLGNHGATQNIKKGMVIIMDPEGTMIYNIIWVLLLILISGFFSLSEGAVIALSDTKLKKLSEEGDKGAKKLLALIKEPSKFLAIVQTGITFCGLLSAMVAVRSFLPSMTTYFTGLGISVGYSVAIGMAIIVVTNSFLMLIIGKLFPRRLGSYYPQQVALSVATPLQLLSYLMIPLVVISNSATNLLLKLMGLTDENMPEHLTEEEIRMLVDVGEEKGVIEQEKKDMINNIFEFDDRTVSEIMTHRMDVIGVDINTDIHEIVKTAMDSGYSRIPVYEDSIDRVVGILYTKDLLKFVSSTEEFNIDEVMRKPMYAPESTSCTQLLTEFKVNKVQFAVVVDEFGGTYGIITMEDLLETIVGDIQDEYDNEEAEIIEHEDGSFTFDGNLAIDDVESALETEIASSQEDWDTLGGLVIHELGRIPEDHEQAEVIISGIQFKVLEAFDRRILKVKATFINKDEDN